MNQSITFIETCASSPHLETTLEIAKHHLDKGDIVYYHFIGNRTSYNDFPKPPHKLLFFQSSAVELGIKLIKHPKLRFDRGCHFELKENIVIPEFDNLDTLKKFKYKSYHAGLACVSSLISRLRFSKPLPSENKEMIKRILISGISVYEYSLSQFKRDQTKLVYLFNGRFAANRAILEAALHAGIPFCIHERGANKKRYSVSSYRIHDLKKLQENILAHWNAEPSNNYKVDVAREFFTSRRKGVEQGWTSFINEQTPGSGIDINLQGRKLVVYYSSSNDEYESVGDIVNWGAWKNQEYAFKQLLQIISKNPERLYLAVRLHPHTKVKHPLELKNWLDIEMPPNATVIKPDSNIDSYALLEQACVVVTCGSSIGIESVYWGVPSICIGPDLYSKLDAVFYPSNCDELKNLLLSDDLKVYPERVFPYGFYHSTHGKMFNLYEAETLFKGKFMGINLQEEHFVRKIRRKIRLIKNYIIRPKPIGI